MLHIECKPERLYDINGPKGPDGMSLANDDWLTKKKLREFPSIWQGHVSAILR